MQIPPPFTLLSIARNKDLIHTPSIHSSLAFSVYCLPLYTMLASDSAIFAVSVKAGGFKAVGAGALQVSVGEQDGWSKRMTLIKVEMERRRAVNERVQ